MAKRIHIKKSTNRLRLYENDTLIREFRVATGKTPEITPTGRFTIVFKTHCPGWTNPRTDEFVKGCTPRNPLGTRWLGLSIGSPRGKEYGIHGTNQPWSIGRHISLGCVRMHNRDVEWLYDQVPLGSTVVIEA